MSRARTSRPFAIVVLFAAFAPAFAQDDALQAGRRARMIEVIDLHAQSAQIPDRPSRISEPVVAAMSRVPRHEFVPPSLREFAYADRPLPIGHGQTISQPYIVALMTDLLEVPSGGKALEIGTGSGYQAAVLAELGIRVFTIEIVPELAGGAAARLFGLGYDRAVIRVGDGYYGWEEEAPFDGIMVTAAASHIPPPLIRQLKPGGRMVLPVGDPFTVQHLVLVTKGVDGSIQTRQLLPVRFVPLVSPR